MAGPPDRDRDRNSRPGPRGAHPGMVGGHQASAGRADAGMSTRAGSFGAAEPRLADILANRAAWNEPQGSYNVPVGGIDPQDRGLPSFSRVDSAIDTGGLFGRTDPYGELRNDAPVDPSAGLDRWSDFGKLPTSLSEAGMAAGPLDAMAGAIDPATRFGNENYSTPVPTPITDVDPFRARDSGSPVTPTQRALSPTLDASWTNVKNFLDDPAAAFSNIGSEDVFGGWMNAIGAGLPVPPAMLRVANELLSNLSPMDDSTATSAAAKHTTIGQFTPNGWPGLQDTFGTQGDPNNLNAEQPFSGGPREGPGTPRLPSAPLGAEIGLAPPPVAPQGPSDAQLTDFLQQGFRSQLGNIFPGNAFNLDQSIIDSIVGERLGEAQGQVASFGGGGANLNPTGSSIANQLLTGQSEAAGQSVSDIGGGVLSANQRAVDAIRDRALADIGNFQFGDPFFDPTPFAAEREALIGERTPTLGTDIRTALGSDPLFDVSEALRAGGGGQGLVSGIPSQSSQPLLDVIAAREGGASPTTRTIGRSSGSGTF